MSQWIYKQSTGELFRNGKIFGKGYSGVLTSKNNPDREHVRGMGPIPRGQWRIGSTGNSKGPLTITLNYISGSFFGRDLRTFRIHGEKIHGVPGFASAGCIIINYDARLLVSKDTGAVMEVVR